MDALRTKKATERTGIDPRLQGRVLFIARTIWLAPALFVLVLIMRNLLEPLSGGQTFICPFSFTSCPPTYDAATLQALTHAQIPLAAYTAYVTVLGVLTALISIGISVFIFWRKSDQLVGLMSSFALLYVGVISLTQADHSTLPQAVQVFTDHILVSGMLLCLGLFLVVFPDSRFVPRWSWLIGCTLFVQGIFFQIPGPLNILNWPPALFVLELVIAYGSPVVIQIYRYACVSTPAQRQQTKWLVFGLASAGLFIVCFYLLGTLFASLGASSLYQLAGDTVGSLAFLIIPLSIGIAILRSQLWDIDVIINRTLIYGLLTCILVLVYLGLDIAGEALLAGIFGSSNGIVIVGSTMLVAALFQPLRRGIQNVIDRRFYRQKYDAARTLQEFSATLRQEVDLTQLSEQIVAVVQETVQPAHVSLWLLKSGHKVPASPEATVESRVDVDP